MNFLQELGSEDARTLSFWIAVVLALPPSLLKEIISVHIWRVILWLSAVICSDLSKFSREYEILLFAPRRSNSKLSVFPLPVFSSVSMNSSLKSCFRGNSSLRGASVKSKLMLFTMLLALCCCLETPLAGAVRLKLGLTWSPS